MSSRASELGTGAFVLRWVLLSVVAFGFAIGCVFFGLWQWTRTYNILESERAQIAAPVDVTTVTSTDPTSRTESIGRNVTATGRYDPARQVFISNRLLDGDVGVWVVTALVLDDGSTMPVLRGWLASPSDPGAFVPTQPVTVSGLVTAYETFYAGADPKVPVSMSEETLRVGWGGATRDGILWLTGQRLEGGASQPSDAASAPAPIPPSVVLADVPFPWQNFFYAFQWWVFAAFAVILWVRWLALELRARCQTGKVGEESTTVGAS